MKIEKLNDNQVKCILTREDLAKRKLKLSELLYGSEKARALFSDMLHIAEEECGFEGEDMPMMIEAIPTPPDKLTIIITKVENPDELDVRFSEFTPMGEEGEETEDRPIFSGVGLDLFGEDAKEVIMDFVDKMRKLAEDSGLIGEPDAKEGMKRKPAKNTHLSFEFDTLEQIAGFAHSVSGSFKGGSELYKETSTGKYYLMLTLGREAFENFRRICNMACEFGKTAPSFTKAYYDEHFEKIIGKNALTTIENML